MEVSGCMCTSRLSHGKDCPHRYCGGSASRGWRMAGQPAPGQQLRDGCGTFFGFVTVSASCEFCYYWLLKIHVQNSHSHRCEKINFWWGCCPCGSCWPLLHNAHPTTSWMASKASMSPILSPRSSILLISADTGLPKIRKTSAKNCARDSGNLENQQTITQSLLHHTFPTANPYHPWQYSLSYGRNRFQPVANSNHASALGLAWKQFFCIFQFLLPRQPQLTS